MLKNILATTALATILSTSAMAASSTMSDNDNAMPEANAQTQTENSNLFMFELHTLAEDATRGYLASNLIGKYVYTSEAEDAETVGDINDIVINEQGQVSAVIVGAGGFLGLGEKDVAIDFSRLQMAAVDEDEMRVISDVTKEELEAAKEYTRPDYIPDWMTTSSVREEINEVTDATEETRETVRNEADTKMDEAQTERAAYDNWMEGKTPVENGTVTAENLEGAPVYNAKNEEIGEVADVVMKTDGSIEAAILDIGGFLGIGEKPVAMSFEQLKFFADEDGDLSVQASVTEEELNNAAVYDETTYADQKDTQLIGS